MAKKNPMDALRIVDHPEVSLATANAFDGAGLGNMEFGRLRALSHKDILRMLGRKSGKKIMDEIDRLLLAKKPRPSPMQVDVFRSLDFGMVWSGPGAWPGRTLEGMARRGWFKRGRAKSGNVAWKITSLGQVVANSVTGADLQEARAKRKAKKRLEDCALKLLKALQVFRMAARRGDHLNDPVVLAADELATGVIEDATGSTVLRAEVTEILNDWIIYERRHGVEMPDIAPAQPAKK